MTNKIIHRLAEEKLSLAQIKEKCGLSETEIIREMTRFWIENGIDSANEIALRIGLPESQKARVKAAKAVITMQKSKEKDNSDLKQEQIIIERELNSFDDFYSHALKNKVPFLKLISEIKERTSRGRDYASQDEICLRAYDEQEYSAKSIPRMIIHDVWFDSKGKKNKITLREFSDEVHSKLKQNKTSLDKNCSLEAYVAKELFEIAQERKHQNVSIHKKLEAKTNNPISGAELESLLEINFGEDEKRIIGIIDEETIGSEYPLNKFYRFADKNNKPFEIEGCPSWSGEGKEFTRMLLTESIENHILRSEIGIPHIKYLGLEGASFNSYISIAELAQSNGVGLEAKIIENNRRIANVMKSIARSKIKDNEKHNSVFENVDVINSNIDHQILLDFVNPSKLSLTRSGESDERSYVTHNPVKSDSAERISLKHYHEMLQEIEKNVDKKLIKRKYHLSDEFLDALNQRSNEKFNVVFLDYSVPRRVQNNKVLENLARTRLEDCCVVGITYNLGLRPGMNEGIHRERDKVNERDLETARKNYAAEINKEVSKQLGKSGFEIVEVKEEIYKDSKEPMLFLCYSLKKGEKNG